MSIFHPKHAVIFGGSGFLGRHLVRRLARDNWDVTVATRRAHRSRELLVLPTVRMVEAKRLDDDTINTLLSENVTVINLIGILHESGTQTFEDVHANLPQRIATIGMEKNIRRLIHISSLGADVDAPSQYLKSKGQGEQNLFEAMQLGLQCEIIRPSIIYGPDDSFTRLFAKLLKLAKGFFFVIEPESQMQPVYVGDLVECIMHAIVRPRSAGRSFDVGGPQVLTFYELIELIDKLIGSRHKLIPLNHYLSNSIASVMQFAPGKPLTPDNILSLQVPNIIQTDQPEPYGVQPSSFEETAKAWLSPQPQPLDIYRAQARR